MDADVTYFINLPVYTHRGHYVGVVQNVQLDLPGRRIGSLLLTRTSSKIVEGGKSIAVPYRWVASIGDIILLNYFPDKVNVARGEDEVQAEAGLAA